MESQNKILFWTFGGVVGLIVALLVIMFVAVKPEPLTKTVIESKKFEENFSDRVKRYTGLTVSYDEVTSSEDLVARFANFEISNPANPNSPSCKFGTVEGKFSDSFTSIGLMDFQLGSGGCKVHVDEHGQLLGLDVKIDPNLSDLGVLFGAQIEKMRFDGIAMEVIHHISDGTTETTSAEGVNLELSAAIGISEQRANLRVVAGDDTTVQSNILGSELMTMKPRGDISLSLSDWDKMSFGVNLKVEDQDFFPEVDTKNFPAQIAMNGTWRWEGQADIESMQVDFGDLLNVAGKAKTQYNDGAVDIQLIEMQAKSKSSLTKALNVPSLPVTSFDFAAINGSILVDPTKEYDMVTRLKLGDGVLGADGGVPSRLNNAMLVLSTNTGNAPANVPFEFDFVSDGFVSDTYELETKDFFVRAKGAIQNSFNLNLAEMVVGSKKANSQSTLAGSIALDENNSTIDLTGTIDQDLSLFNLGSSDVKGFVRGSFRAQSLEDVWRFEGDLNANVDAVDHPDLYVRNLTSKSKFTASIDDGLPADLVDNFTPDRLLNAWFDAASEVRIDSSMKAENLRFNQPSDMESAGFSLAGVETNALYLDEKQQDTQLSGTFSVDAVDTASIDGRTEEKFENRIEGNWKFVNTDTPGIDLSFEVSKDGKALAKTHAEARLIDSDLKISYGIAGNLPALAESFGSSLLDGQIPDASVQGKLTFPQFYSEPDLKQWDIQAFTLPYEGLPHGTFEATLRNVELKNFQQVRSLKSPKIRLVGGHMGHQDSQEVSVKVRSQSVAMVAKDGQESAMSGVTGSVEGTIALPMPSSRAKFIMKGKSDRVRTGAKTKRRVPYSVEVDTKYFDDDKTKASIHVGT